MNASTTHPGRRRDDRPEAPTLYTTDRSLSVQCALEENVMRLSLRPVDSDDDHFMRLEFTKGFATELYEFLGKHLNSETGYGEAG